MTLVSALYLRSQKVVTVMLSLLFISCNNSDPALEESDLDKLYAQYEKSLRNELPVRVNTSKPTGKGQEGLQVSITSALNEVVDIRIFIFLYNENSGHYGYKQMESTINNITPGRQSYFIPMKGLGEASYIVTTVKKIIP